MLDFWSKGTRCGWWEIKTKSGWRNLSKTEDDASLFQAIRYFIPLLVTVAKTLPESMQLELSRYNDVCELFKV